MRFRVARRSGALSHAAADRQEIFAGYTQTYLERDLRDLAAIDNLYDFQRLMRAACLRGLLLYGGERIFWISEGVLAAPWWRSFDAPASKAVHIRLSFEVL
jgi:hypothetical protein